MDDDKKLIVALKANDHKAFDSLFRKYAQKLYNFSLVLIKDKFVAEEMVQVVFLKIWEKRHLIEEHYSFQSFLFTIAHHEIISWIRKTQSEQRKTLIFHTNNSLVTNETEIKIEFQNYETLAEQLIELLPEKRRLIFNLSRKEGLSNKEIAQKLSLSLKTVENQMTAALRFLRKNLEKESILGLLYYALFLHP